MLKIVEKKLERAKRNLAVQVKTRRGEAGQREFARQTGIDQGALSRIEAQKAGVTLEMLVRLGHAFKCEPGELLTPVEKTKPAAAETVEV